MSSKNELVAIQLKETPPSLSPKREKAKLALRIKKKNGDEIFIYNGIHSYILQALLKELS